MTTRTGTAHYVTYAAAKRHYPDDVDNALYEKRIFVGRPNYRSGQWLSVHDGRYFINEHEPITLYHYGAPPSLGWWPTIIDYPVPVDSADLRWWDGQQWSYAVSIHCTAYTAGRIVEDFKRDDATHKVMWTHCPDNWPERSRT